MKCNPQQARDLLTDMFRAAVEAADPAKAMERLLPPRPAGKTVVIAIGKAAIPMSIAFEAMWPHPIEGVVVDRHGASGRPERLALYHAAHPVPDEAGAIAAQAVFDAVSGLTTDDLVIVLMSGGGSALLPAPVDGLTLADEQAVNRSLLASGLPISEMNMVRAHLSRIKGGGLTAAARPARVVTFVVSDVPGDDPALVSSGPTLQTSRPVEDVLSLLEVQKLPMPDAAITYLCEVGMGSRTPPPREESDEVHLLASAEGSLAAAAIRAQAAGFETVILSDAIEGEAATVGSVHAAIAKRCVTKNAPFKRPLALLSGGETTVTIRGEAGRGGRNSEFLLAFAKDIAGVSGIYALAADTDGIDGSEDNAGAFADTGTFERMLAAGINPQAALTKHDAYTAFKAIGNLFTVGPTGTNVNDFRAVLIF